VRQPPQLLLGPSKPLQAKQHSLHLDLLCMLANKAQAAAAAACRLLHLLQLPTQQQTQFSNPD
jgi:hypothetical protein